MFSLGSLFSRQPAPMLGLDISSSSVKLVELDQDKNGQLILKNCAIVPLERGWINDGNVEKFDEVADAVRRVVVKSGTKTKNVAMALPPSAVITKKSCCLAVCQIKNLSFKWSRRLINTSPFR